MLFAVQMKVNLPPDLPAETSDRLKATEREKAQALQRARKWLHLWRVAGRYENLSIFDVGSIEELHEIISTLPLFPYMKISVVPLCRHPSAIDV